VNRYPTFFIEMKILRKPLTFTLSRYYVFSVIIETEPLTKLFDQRLLLRRTPRRLAFLSPVGPLGGMFRLNDRNILVVAIA
jgi:hypothetical protein